MCAHCGDADCPGCLHEQTRSGVVAVVPWERPGAPALTRLWATARATTFDAERFFESMPDGPIAPALRFAVASEMIAATAMGLLAIVPLSLIAPAWVKHVVVDEGATLARARLRRRPGARARCSSQRTSRTAGRSIAGRAARAPAAATSRAVRFGLYAAGWDLVIGPLGAIVVAVKEGARAALSIAGIGVGLPGRSARAFLRGCYHLDGAAAQPALRASYAAAVIATAVGTVAVIAALVAVLLL